jgi:hypothetical protein
MELGGAGTPCQTSQSAAGIFRQGSFCPAGRIQIVGDLEVTGDIINVCTGPATVWAGRFLSRRKRVVGLWGRIDVTASCGTAPPAAWALT